MVMVWLSSVSSDMTDGTCASPTELMYFHLIGRFRGLDVDGDSLLLLSRFSRVQHLATPWTAAHQAPLSMGSSRQEYWSGVPLPSPLLLFIKYKR